MAQIMENGPEGESPMGAILEKTEQNADGDAQLAKSLPTSPLLLPKSVVV